MRRGAGELHARMQWRVLTAGWEAPVRRKKAKCVCVRALDSLAKRRGPRHHGRYRKFEGGTHMCTKSTVRSM